MNGECEDQVGKVTLGGHVRDGRDQGGSSLVRGTLQPQHRPYLGGLLLLEAGEVEMMPAV